MMIRAYAPGDRTALTALFYDTVHTVCARDYAPAQLDAWAPADPDAAAWDAALEGRTVLVAEENGALWGFGSIGEDGYLDLLYVHKDHQGRGVGSVLCDFLEMQCPAEHVTVHASKTARGFFEARGYRALRRREVERRGQTLTNFVMERETD